MSFYEVAIITVDTQEVMTLGDFLKLPENKGFMFTMRPDGRVVKYNTADKNPNFMFSAKVVAVVEERFIEEQKSR